MNAFPKLYQAVEDTNRGISSDRPAIRLDDSQGKVVATITLSGYRVGLEKSPQEWAAYLVHCANEHANLKAIISNCADQMGQCEKMFRDDVPFMEALNEARGVK